MIEDDDEEEVVEAPAATTETENIAEPKKVKKRNSRIKDETAKKEQVFRELLGNPYGRAALWEILNIHHPFEIELVTSSGLPDGKQTWLKLGEQMMGLRLFRWWQKIDPDGVLLMQKENDPLLQKPQRTSR